MFCRLASGIVVKPIDQIGEKLGLLGEEVLPYAAFKAKVSLTALERLKDRPLGRYVLVTAMNPTPLGEGKTTTSIGLAMALSRLGYSAAVTPRQPSLGPVFGIKGGATGGGKAQIFPNGGREPPFYRRCACCYGQS